VYSNMGQEKTHWSFAYYWKRYKVVKT